MLFPLASMFLAGSALANDPPNELDLPCDSASSPDAPPSSADEDGDEMAEPEAPLPRSLQTILAAAKRQVLNMEQAEIRERTIVHMVRMGLLEADGTWKGDLAGAFPEDELFELEAADLVAELEQVASLVARNPYMVTALNAVVIASDGQGSNYAPGSISGLKEKPDEEITDVVRDATTFAVALKTLSHTIVAQKGLLERVANAMGIVEPTARRYLHNFMTHGPLAGLKMSTVEDPIVETLQAERPGNDINPNFGYWLLFVNIFEMHVVDSVSNAEVGRKLSLYPVGRPSGNGDTQFADNGAGPIELPVRADAKAYADMYQAWNAGFGASSPVWPYFMAKLFNSEVADYDDAPETYMHKRVVALVLFLHWRYTDELTTTPGRDIDWSTPALAETFGRANLDNMADFEARSPERAGSVLNWIADRVETKPTPEVLFEQTFRGLLR